VLISDRKQLYNKELELPPNVIKIRIVSEIERRFSVADILEQTINISLEKAEKIKQSILKQAFEGRLL
jgi:type I restriction enzyme, S subunit